MFVDCWQKMSADKSKQTSTFLETRNSNKSSFEHLLTYLSLSINGLLEMWLRLLTFYFKILKYFLRQQPRFGRMTGDFLEAHSWVALLCQSFKHYFQKVEDIQSRGCLPKASGSSPWIRQARNNPLRDTV